MDIVTVGWDWECFHRVVSLSSSHHSLLCNSITNWPRCSYRTAGSSLVIHGRVTDFQMWDRVLPDFQLEEVETIPKWRSSILSSTDHRMPPLQGGQPGQLDWGNVAPEFLTWHSESFLSQLFHIESIQFALALLQAKREELDLEGSVCAKSSTSLQILPHKTNVMELFSLFFSIIIFPSDEACSITSLLQIFRKGKSHFKFWVIFW